MTTMETNSPPIAPFRIKICGVRIKSDVEAVGQSRADAIGLNFFAPSIRHVGDPAATELSRIASSLGLVRVGVFVNESVARMNDVADAVGLDVIQLHGNERVEWVADLDRPVVRAVKLPTGPIEASEIERRTRDWIRAGCHVLLDADAGAGHGGSGKLLDWPSIAAFARTDVGKSVGWTLAGGLTPENVGEAIRVGLAISVDTASGVEHPRGRKDADRIERFAAEAAAAWGGRHLR